MSAILIAVIYKKVADDVDYYMSKKLWNNRDKRERIIADINRLVKKIASFPFWTVRQGLQYFGNHYPQVLGIEI